MKLSEMVQNSIVISNDIDKETLENIQPEVQPTMEDQDLAAEIELLKNMAGI